MIPIPSETDIRQEAREAPATLAAGNPFGKTGKKIAAAFYYHYTVTVI